MSEKDVLVIERDGVRYAVPVRRAENQERKEKPPLPPPIVLKVRHVAESKRE